MWGECPHVGHIKVSLPKDLSHPPLSNGSFVWNISGMLSSKAIAIVFGILETKMRKENFIAFRQSVIDEWDIVGNVNDDDEEPCNSIWVGWRKATWSYQLLFTHRQCIHGKFTNPRGYSFDMMVIYGE